MKLQTICERYAAFRKTLGERFATNGCQLKAFCRAMGPNIDIADVSPEKVNTNGPFKRRSKRTDAIQTARFGTIRESLALIRVARMKCDFGLELGGFLKRKRMGPALVTLTPLAGLAVIVLFLQMALFAAGQSPTQSLDFEYYRTRVEPIFLKKRPGHARCVACHAGSNNAFSLQHLPTGRTTWTEEQSRRNFEIVSRLVTPGDPASSRLLLHALSPKAGGDAFHSGGRQFASQNDPDWRVLADWVRNAKISPSTTP